MKIILCCLLLCSFRAFCSVEDSTVTSAIRDSTLLETEKDSTQKIHYPNFFIRLGNDFVEQAQAPFTMSTNDAVQVAVGIGITGALIVLDESIDKRFRYIKRDNNFIRRTSPTFTELGGVIGIVGTLSFAGYSFISNNKKGKETSELLIESIITSGVWVRIGKLVFSRERPSAAYSYSHQSGGRWYGPFGRMSHRFESVTQGDAFPSGHSATIFAIAAVIAEQYKEYSAVPPISYSIATLVVITRIIEHTHWASDVFVGSVIGYLCAQQVVHSYRKENSNLNTEVSLGLLDQRPSLNVILHF